MRQHSTDPRTDQPADLRTDQRMDPPAGLSTAHAFRRLARGLRLVLLIALAVLFLVPFYLLVRNGLATEADITGADWTFFPHSLQWGNLRELFDDSSVPMLHALWNSAVIAVLTTVGTLLLASMAGYGLARIAYPYASQVFYAFLVTLMIPSAVTFVPSFVLVSSLGWISTLRGLIVPTLFSAFAAFLFRQYFLGFPGSWRTRPGWTGSATGVRTGGSSSPTHGRSSPPSGRSSSSARGIRSSGPW